MIFLKQTSFNSTILDNQSESLLCEFITQYKPIKETKLIYKASVDGFEAVRYHENCDGIPNIVTIIKSSNGNVFGGFASSAMKVGYIRDKNAFIFSLINEDNKPQKYPLNQCFVRKAIYCSKNFGPKFGIGYDLEISNNSNCNNYSCSKTGKCFGELCEARFLAGTYYFIVSEIEVFSLKF